MWDRPTCTTRESHHSPLVPRSHPRPSPHIRHTRCLTPCPQVGSSLSGSKVTTISHGVSGVINPVTVSGNQQRLGSAKLGLPTALVAPTMFVLDLLCSTGLLLFALANAKVIAALAAVAVVAALAASPRRE